ncbi:MAG: hypothetical protein AAFV53_18185 [Myxococcota bacterium]
MSSSSQGSGAQQTASSGPPNPLADGLRDAMAQSEGINYDTDELTDGLDRKREKKGEQGKERPEIKQTDKGLQFVAKLPPYKVALPAVEKAFTDPPVTVSIGAGAQIRGELLHEPDKAPDLEPSSDPEMETQKKVEYDSNKVTGAYEAAFKNTSDLQVLGLGKLEEVAVTGGGALELANLGKAAGEKADISFGLEGKFSGGTAISGTFTLIRLSDGWTAQGPAFGLDVKQSPKPAQIRLSDGYVIKVGCTLSASASITVNKSALAKEIAEAAAKEKAAEGAASLGAVPAALILGGLLTAWSTYKTLSTPIDPDKQKALAENLAASGVDRFMNGIYGQMVGGGSPLLLKANTEGLTARYGLKRREPYRSWLEQGKADASQLMGDQQKILELAEFKANEQLTRELRKQDAQFRSAAMQKLAPAAKMIVWRSWLANYDGKVGAGKAAVAIALFGDYNSMPPEVRIQSGYDDAPSKPSDKAERQMFDTNTDRVDRESREHYQEDERRAQEDLGRKVTKDISRGFLPSSGRAARERESKENAVSRTVQLQQQVSAAMKGANGRATLTTTSDRAKKRYGRGYSLNALGNTVLAQIRAGDASTDFYTLAEQAAVHYNSAISAFQEGDRY